MTHNDDAASCNCSKNDEDAGDDRQQQLSRTTTDDDDDAQQQLQTATKATMATTPCSGNRQMAMTRTHRSGSMGCQVRLVEFFFVFLFFNYSSILTGHRRHPNMLRMG
jgi:hypothetical protein